MPYYVYILKCSDGLLYTGVTNNLDYRLSQHSLGEGGRFTSKRLPVKLVFSEPFEQILDAIRAEKQIKGWSRKKKFLLIKGEYELLGSDPSTSSG